MEHQVSLHTIRKKIDDVQRFLAITLQIANAHTVDFYTGDIWDTFMAVSPEDVLSQFSASAAAPGTLQIGTLETNFGFCHETGKLVDIGAFLQAAEHHSLPQLGVAMTTEMLMKMLSEMDEHLKCNTAPEPDDFMNSKKAHEVHAMSYLVAFLAQHCRVKQIIDVGSGKGYLSSHLSMQYGLQVFGLDSSSNNTHGAQERNRKLKRYSRANRRSNRTRQGQENFSPSEGEQLPGVEEEPREGWEGMATENVAPLPGTQMNAQVSMDGNCLEPVACTVENECLTDPFLSALSLYYEEPVSTRVPPSQLSKEEKEQRMRENLERKLKKGRKSSSSNLFLPLTSYVTAETELKEIIPELKNAVTVGLHTCGDLAPSTLRMFVTRQEIQATCSVGCCYHLLTEEFDQRRSDQALTTGQMEIVASDVGTEVFGFPMSQYLREQMYVCGRNARMSACLALERVTAGGGLPVESLFYRAVLHVILKDYYNAHKSEKRVGNVYSKTSSFVEYIRRALTKLGLDGSKISDEDIQMYHDKYKHRICEMVAFNRLKVTLAPCIEGLILLDRLCYLKEQENVSFGALVQLFDPLMSPRCYGLVALKVLP